MRVIHNASAQLIRLCSVLCLYLWMALASADVVIPDPDRASRGSSGAAKSVLSTEVQGDLLVVEFDGSYDRRVAGQFNESARIQVAQAVYAQLPDEFDFIVVLPAFDINMDEVVGLHWQVSNAVQGIGRPTLDLSAEYGSSGRLKGVLDLDESLWLADGPLAHDQLLDTLMHEVMHQWGVYVQLRADAGDASTLLATSGSHWSAKYDSDASVMLGARWRESVPGRFQSIKVRDGFGPLDLYLAGFLSAAELADTQFIRSMELQPEDLPVLGREIDGTTLPVQTSEVLQTLGPRQPDASAAQRRFRAAVVLLVRPEQAIPANLLGVAERLRAQAQIRFAALTLGRGQLELGIGRAAQATQRGTPVLIDTSAPAAVTLNLPQARGWLQSKQRANGLWSDKPATTAQDTRRALQAIALSSGDDPAGSPGALALAGLPASDVDTLSAVLLAPGLSPARRAELSAALLEQRRPDGGWGLSAGLRSAALDTALALRALRVEHLREQSTVDRAVIATAADTLLSMYRPASACWPSRGGPACDFLASAHALLALAEFLPAAALTEHGQGLYRYSQPGGGFGVGARSVFETALALSALQAAGTTGDPRFTAAVDYLASQQRSDGSFAGSVSATAEALSGFVQRQVPDLSFVGGIEATPANPYPGQLVQLRSVVRNAGLLATPVAAVLIEHAAPEGGPWVPLDQPTALPALSPGGVTELLAQFNTQGLPPGNRRIRISLDPEQALAESDESNNQLQLDLLLRAPVSGIEFAVSAEDLQLDPAILTALPQSIELRAKLHNYGLSAASAVPVTIYGSRFGQLLPLQSTSIDLPAQSQVELVRALEITDVDIRRIVLVIDPDLTLVEPDRSNNRAEVALDSQPTVDLAVLESDLQTPASSEIGQPASFGITLRNPGTRDSPVAVVRVSVERANGSMQPLSEFQLQIPAASSVVRQALWTPDLEGLSRLHVVIDPEELITEIREDNNAASAAFTVGASSQPNLRIDGDSWQVLPSPALQGQPVELSVTVQNPSTLAAPAFSLQFDWAAQGSNDFTALQSVRVESGLAAGASQVVSIQPMVNLASDRQVRVRVDSAAEIAESDETDNQGLHSFAVRSLPNLQVNVADLNLSPSNPPIGSTVSLQVTVRNTGQQAVSAAGAALYQGSGASAAALGSAMPITNLPPDGQTTLVFQFTRDAELNEIELRLDPEQEVTEGREDDNSAILKLNQSDPDFYISERYISPNGDGVQDSSDLLIRIDPAAAGTAGAFVLRIVAPWGEEMARFASTASATQISATWNGRRSDGRRVPDDRYQLRLEDAAGALLKLESIVVDTNRSPLVRAAIDGHARVRSLSCQFFQSTSLNVRYSRPGLNFAIAEHGFPTAIYQVPFSGPPARKLLTPSQIPGHQDHFGWVSGDSRSYFHTVSLLSGQSVLFGADLEAEGMAQVMTTLPFGMQEFLGEWSDGRQVLRSNERLVLLDPDSGQWKWLSGEGDIDWSGGTRPVVGSESVLVWSSSDSSAPMELRLLREDSAIDVVVALPRPIDRVGEMPRVVFSKESRAYYFATGALYADVSDPDVELVVSISEIDASVTEIIRTPPNQLPENYAVSLSPDSRTLAILRGKAASIDLLDLTNGQQRSVDMSQLRPSVDSENPVTTGFFAAFWSADSLGLVTRLEAGVTGDGSYIIASASIFLDVINASARSLAPFHAEAWLDGEWQLVGGSEGMALERGDQVMPLLIEDEVGSHWQGVVQGTALPFEMVPNASGDCEASGTQVLKTTANGTTEFELEYLDASKTFLVTGSALDLNFNDARLYFRVVGAAQWTEISAFDRAIDDRFMVAWSPPAPGNYEIRLQVRDLAGNIVHADQDITWFENSPLGVTRLDSDYFSPNGDGILEDAVVNYELRTPMSLDFQVRDSSGSVVRSQTVLQIQAGVYAWAWNGRDQQGMVVADGQYRISLNDRSFTITLDTVLPLLEAQEVLDFPVCGQGRLRSGKHLDLLRGQWPITSQDMAMEEVVVEGRLLRPGAPWQYVRKSYWPDMPRHVATFSAEEVREMQFRVVAKDAAGNLAMANIPFERASISSARWTDLDVGENWKRMTGFYDSQNSKHYLWKEARRLPDSARLGITARDLSEWRLQYQPATQREPVGDRWLDLPLNEISRAQDTAEGGDLNDACFGAGEWLVDLPLPTNGEAAFVRLLHRSGHSQSLVLHLQNYGSNEEDEEEEECEPGSELCEQEFVRRCEMVGGATARIPLRTPGAEASWFDVRVGETRSLPVTADGVFHRVGVEAMPHGAHIVEVSVEDGEPRYLVGKDGDGAPRVTILFPQNLARTCRNMRLIAKLEDDFLETIGVEEVTTGQPLALEVPPLIPFPGFGGLLSLNPNVEVFDLEMYSHGTAHLRVSGIDCVGNVGSADINVRVDAAVEHDPLLVNDSRSIALVEGVAVPSHVFSPNLGQIAPLKLFVRERLRLKLSLHEAGTPPRVTPQGIEGQWKPGELIAVLHEREVSAGTALMSWDGLVPGGAPLADGVYVLLVTASDECGNEELITAPVKIDNTPPTVEWSEPLAGSIPALFQALKGVLEDVSPMDADIAVKAPGEQNWEFLVSSMRYGGTPPKQRSPLHTWHSIVPAGEYQLRLRARDKVGHQSEQIITVTVPERSPMLALAQRAPELISPNGDGVLDSTTAQLNLLRAAQLRVEVINAGNTVVRTLLDDLVTGIADRVWNGLDGSEMVVPDGAYQLRVRAVDPIDPTVIETVDLPVDVDNTAPALRWVAPSGLYSNGRGPLTVGLLEPHPGSLTVSSAPTMPGLVRQFSTTGYLALADLDAVEEGSYQLAFAAQDAVGNAAQYSHDLIIDRTAPAVLISTPTADQVLSRRDSAIPITGTVADLHLAQWSVYLLDAQGERLRTLASQSSSVSGPIQAQWDGAEVDGAYQLELEAVDLAGNSGSARVAVLLDNTPPVARIDLPTQSAFVRLSFEVSGAATDANLRDFHLDIALPASSPAWQRAASGSAATEGVLASLVAPDPDGDYLLRLTVTDRAGNQSEVFRQIQVDTAPPLAPVALTATRSPPRAAQLSWTASPSPDVVAYRIYRGSTALLDTPTAATQHTDNNLEDGRYLYRVSALDRAGNESPKSNEASVRIDTTPPEVNISSPRVDERRRAEVRVEGRAYSRDDFERYELHLRRLDPPGTSTLVASGGSAVLAGELGRFDSVALGITEDQVQLDLTAWDSSDNQATHAVVFSIDNLPPAAPIDVTAVEDNGAVRISWTANTETDLAGYLVYRGPVLLQGNPSSDPRSIVVSATEWMDDQAGDGQFEWRVLAVDTTANLSAFSNPAALTRSGNPPRVNLIRPAPGQRFDGSLLMRGQSADADLAQVQFESRGLGAPDWTPVLAPFSAPPFEGDFAPVAGAYGPYRLRASSVDTEGLSDPEPPEVEVEYVDLTPPAAPAALTAVTDGDVVQLDWSAVTDTDLDGYRIERALAEGPFQTLVTTAANVLTHPDIDLADGRYRYRVRAVDAAGNASTPTPEVNARVYTLVLSRPYTPDVDASAELRLRSPVAGVLESSVLTDSGNSVLSEQPIAETELVLALNLALGENTYTYRVRDAQGNRSRAASLLMLRSDPPPAPDTLQAQVTDLDVALSWNMPSHPDPLGFRVFRNGAAVLADADAQIAMVSNAGGVTFGQLIDGDPQSATYFGEGNTELRAELSEASILVSAELEFGDADLAASTTVQLSALWRGEWIPLPVAFAQQGALLRLQLLKPYRTTALRLEFTTSQELMLAELRLTHRPLLEQSPLLETVSDGVQNYRVRAVNQHAIEGPDSAPLEVAVGDAEAPEAVVLSGSVNGSDISLEWTASSSPDLAAYWLMRGSERIAIISDLNMRSWLDAGRPNGQYDYRVIAVDGVGNIAPSNLLSLLVDVGTLAAPVGLSVSALPGGGALRLEWQAGSGGVPASRYQVMRALAQTGPYVAVADVVETSFDDNGLNNGTRYFYKVIARDAVGNSSADSNVASAVPFTDAPVSTPVFHYPTRFGSSYTTRQRSAVATGVAQPGSSLLLGVGSSVVPAVAVPAQAQQRAVPNESGFYGVVSPDGLHGATYDRVLVLQSDTVMAELSSSCAEPQWLDAQRLLICESRNGQAEVAILHLPALNREALLTAQSVSFMRVTPDGLRIVLGAQLAPSDPEPVLAWRDLDDADLNLVPNFPVNSVYSSTPRLDPSGRWMVYLDTTAFRLAQVDLLSGERRVLDLEVDFAHVAGFAPETGVALAAGLGPDGQRAYRIDLNSGALTALDLGTGIPVVLDVDPQYQRVAVTYTNLGWRFYRWPELTLEAGGMINGSWQLQRLATGEWALQQDGALQILQPAGLFRVENIPLAFGENLLSAIGNAPGQLSSTPALPITLIVPADGLPDLVVREQDLSTLPNAVLPGNSVRVGARIRNTGSGSASSSTVQLRLTAPDGEVLDTQNVPLAALAPGQERSVAWTTPLLVNAGLYRLSVVIDPQQVLAESSTANNRASRSVLVNVDGHPELLLSSAQTLLAPTDTFRGSVELIAAQASFGGRLRVRVLDDQDYLVQTLFDAPVQLATPTAVLNQALQWSPAGVRAGPYRIHAQLYSSTGQLLRERSLPLTVQSISLFALELSPGQLTRTVGESLQLDARLRLISSNTRISEAQLRVYLRSAAGEELVSRVLPLPELDSGFDASLPLSFNTQDLTGGAYAVTAELWSAELLAEGGAAVTMLVGTAAPRVQGSVQLPAQPQAAGTAASYALSVRNSGGTSITDLPIVASLRQQASGQLIANLTLNRTLAAGETWQGTLNAAGSALPPGGYVLTLAVASGELAGLLDYRSVLVIDQAPPLIEPLSPAPNAIVPRNFVVQARVSDVHSAIGAVELQMGTAAFQPMSASAQFASQYQVPTSASLDGPLQLRVRASDTAANQAQSAPWTVILDGTPPVLQITGVVDGGLYRTPVTPLIEVTELHPLSLAVTLDGVTLPSGAQIEAEGLHNLYVVAIDQAGNRSSLLLSFEIDRTPPPLEFTTPAANAVLQSATTTVRLASEAGAQVQLNVGAQNLSAVAGVDGTVEFLEVALQEGPNLLSATASDVAGNISAPSERTVIRSTATLGLVSGDISSPAAPVQPGTLLAGTLQLQHSGVVPLLQLPVRVDLRSASSGLLVGSQQWLLDLPATDTLQQAWELSSAGLALGNYALELSAELTAAGAAPAWVVLDQQTVTLADLTPPELSWLSPAADALTGAAVLVRLQASDQLSAVASVEVVVDAGAPQLLSAVPGAPGEFEAQLDGLSEGPHALHASAVDDFGNRSTLPPRMITVDTTAPEILISGVADGQLSNVPLVPVIQINDLHPGSSSVELNGVSYVSGTPIEADGVYTLAVQAQDAAGNSAQSSLGFTVDRTPPQLSIVEPLADSESASANIPLLISTEAGIDVTYLDPLKPRTMVSDGDGLARFAAVALTLGENLLWATATDRAGNTSAPVSVRVLRISPKEGDVIGSIEHPAQLAHGDELVGMLRVRSTLVPNAEIDQIRLELLHGETTLDSLVLTPQLLQNVQLELPFSRASESWPLGTVQLRLSWRRGQAPWSFLANSSLQVRDLTPPQITLLTPAFGSTVDNPLIVRAEVFDVLSPLAQVQLRLDNGPWLPMAPGGAPHEWHGELTLQGGINTFTVRASDVPGNEREFGPVPVCLEDSTIFRHGFEFAPDNLLRSGFEGSEVFVCPQVPQRLLDWLGPWLQPSSAKPAPVPTPTAAPAQSAVRKEIDHAAR